MSIGNALYQGRVRHTRVTPRNVSLQHSCFWLTIDVDRIDATTKALTVLSRNAFNILGFYDRDFGDRSDLSLRAQIERHLLRVNIDVSPEKIILFCMPRVLGYGFNPISLYFCLDEDGAPIAIVYEVHNTFGQRHSYVAKVVGKSRLIEQTADKNFYVSPFMDMDLRYKFKLLVTDKKLSLAISAANEHGPVIFTSLNAKRSALTNKNLLKAWYTHPLLSAKVITAIHFHALRLWLKGIKLRLRPPPPSNPASVGRTGRPAS